MSLDYGIGFTWQGVFGKELDSMTAYSVDNSHFLKGWYHVASQFLLVICAKLCMTFPALAASQQPWRALLSGSFPDHDRSRTPNREI